MKSFLRGRAGGLIPVSYRTLVQILAHLNPEDGEWACPIDVPGCRLQWDASGLNRAGGTGAWVGHLGVLTPAQYALLDLSRASNALTWSTPSGDVQFGGAVTGTNSKGNAVGRRIAFIGNSIAYGCLPSDQSGATYWQPALARTVGQYITPRYVDLRGGYIPRTVICRAAGTTGATEPVWGPIGSTHTDGTVEWEVVAQTTKVSTKGTDWLSWAQAMSGQPLDVQWMLGMSGATCTQIIDMMEARGPLDDCDGVFLGNMFENDAIIGILANCTAAWARFVAYADKLRAAGKTVYTQTILPMSILDYNGSTYVAGNDTKCWLWLNAKLREFAAARRDVTFCDVTDAYKSLDPATPVWSDVVTTYPNGNLTTATILDATDRTHPRQLGAFLIGKLWAKVLDARFPRREFFNPAGADQRAPNPYMYGTGGALSSNVTGTVADSYRASSSASASAACSKITGTKSAPERHVIAATATGQFNYLISNPGITLTPLVVGDMIEAFVEIKVAANPGGFVCPYVQMLFNSSTGIPQVDMYVYADSSQQVGPGITEDTTFLFKTIPVRIPVGTVSVQIRQEMAVSGSVGTPAAATVDFVRQCLRRPAPVALV